ncbi:MAG TPA: methyltransferase domain-containing protein [Alphaproteobacteria bacterium]|nr:methyltransferase domain-containing protein [Alphaproteobacteria bacterium]
MKRVVVPELLDANVGTAREIEDNLADLRMINRRFGGTRATMKLLEEVARRRSLQTVTWLDVGGASGDIAAAAVTSFAKMGIKVEPVVLDLISSHLNGNGFSVCGDALALPFRDQSFDVVGCSLFAHHLEPQQIVQFVREALRVARHAFLINDLIRSPLHLALAQAGRMFYRGQMTRHDAPASVRRAYTKTEMQQIVQECGAGEVEVREFFLFRMGVIVWKQQPSTT